MSDSSLAKALQHAAAIKAEMMRLLGLLEEQAAGRPVDAEPGGWRHHPAEWAATYLGQTKKPN
ncbi:MAG TPA: hypothetical protein VHQ86_03505 [Candidatus Saccharimonadia bacterium]|nr:hypothetical protein [Candidatus Saccharimonadia bacterium]